MKNSIKEAAFMETLRLSTADAGVGLRADVFLAEFVEGLSRSAAARLLEEEGCFAMESPWARAYA